MTSPNFPSFEDRDDFDRADQGLIESLDPCVIYSDEEPKDRVVWDNDVYSFLKNNCPDTVNPSLWRQGQLCYKQGLYKVSEDIYQVRGLDISNISFVEGPDGVIVIDPLTSSECAKTAMELYKKHRPGKTVKGLIYTHSHGDHFGGAGKLSPVLRYPLFPYMTSSAGEASTTAARCNKADSVSL